MTRRAATGKARDTVAVIKSAARAKNTRSLYGLKKGISARKIPTFLDEARSSEISAIESGLSPMLNPHWNYALQARHLINKGRKQLFQLNANMTHDIAKILV